MKCIFSIAILFSFLSVNGQVSISEVRTSYAMTYLDITGSSPSISLLDNYTSTFMALGDKSLIDQLILENIILPVGDNDSELAVDAIQLAREDSAMLLSAIPLSKNLRERPYHTIMYLIFSKFVNEERSIIQLQFDLVAKLDQLYPNLPLEQVITSNRYTDEIINTRNFLNWAIKYPEEYENLCQLLQKQIEGAGYSYASYDEVQRYLAFINDQMSSSVYGYFAPQGIMACREMILGKIPVIPTIAEMRSDTEAFVAQAYKDILERDPQKEELNRLTNYIRKTEDVDPAIVYLTLYRFKNTVDE